jgi:hypothetical protein
MMNEGGRRPDWLGRAVGLTVFAGGISLLIAVFIWTGQLVEFVPKTGTQIDTAAAVRFGVRVAQLFVSGLVASWIAGRGAQMYAAANRAISGD